MRQAAVIPTSTAITDVGDRAFVDEDRHLALTHDQLGVHLGLVLVARAHGGGEGGGGNP